jgi:hypothetical protein
MRPNDAGGDDEGRKESKNECSRDMGEDRGCKLAAEEGLVSSSVKQGEPAERDHVRAVWEG